MNVLNTAVPAATRRVLLTATVVVVGLLAVLVGRADANGTGGPPAASMLAIGATDDRIVVKTHPNDRSTVRTVRLDFDATEATGWHTHPGPGIVTITSGSFTLQRLEATGCTARQLAAGDVFVDDGTPHTLIANAAGAVVVTLVTPTDAGAPTTPVADPGC